MEIIEGYHGVNDAHPYTVDRGEGNYHNEGGLHIGSRGLATVYGDGPGRARLYHVSYPADNPFHVRTAEEGSRLLHESGALDHDEDWHPTGPERVAKHLQAKGHDALVIHQSAFDQKDDSDEAYHHWTDMAGTWGDPQAVLYHRSKAILRPARMQNRDLSFEGLNRGKYMSYLDHPYHKRG